MRSRMPILLRWQRRTTLRRGSRRSFSPPISRTSGWRRSVSMPVFEVPQAREARAPAEARGLERDEVAMLVTHADAGEHEHSTFLDLPRYLRDGDLLVVNDSET